MNQREEEIKNGSEAENAKLQALAQGLQALADRVAAQAVADNLYLVELRTRQGNSRVGPMLTLEELQARLARLNQ